MVVLGRILGFLRYRIYAGYFSKEELDIFLAAFRIPDLVYEILITGALTTSLIPFFIKFQNNKKEQDENISSIMNIIMIVLFILIALLSIFMPLLVHLIAPDYTGTKLKAVTFYTQILLLGQLPFFVFGTFLSGISQAKKAFLLPAIAPIVYNVAIIVVTLFLGRTLFLLGPILGVVTGAILFLIIQIPVLFLANYDYKFIIKKTTAIKDFFMLALPRIFTSSLAQIDATVDLNLSSSLVAGSYTVFYLAQHLQLLPVSVLGISFGQASLPYLSDLYNQKNYKVFKEVIIDSVLNVFFVTVPIMGFFIVTRTPIVRLLFGGQRFDWEATAATAITLSYFAIAIPFHSVYYFLTRCFYAIFDTKTPFIISIISIVINTALSVILIHVYHVPVWALAISFAISMMINFVLLLFFLHVKLGGLDMKLLIWESTKMAISVAIASVVTFYVKKIIDNLILDTTRTINIMLLLTVLTVIFFSIYLFIAWILSIKELALIARMVVKLKQYQKKISDLYTNNM
jgi:putative peptidoglycan lipid II flippase